MSRPNTQLAAAVDFGGTGIKLGLVNPTGGVVARAELVTRDAATPPAWLAAVSDAVRALARQVGVPVEKLAGVGVGAPGFVDFDHGKILVLPNVPGWENFPLAQKLSARLGLPAWVDNDVNAMALGETRFGAGRGLKEAVFLTLGTGVGGALILGGSLYHGAHGMAGEVGHHSIQLHGNRTATGVGGLESYIGNKPIVAYYRKLAGTARSGADLVTVRDIAQAAAAGEEAAVKTFDHVATCLASALASLSYVIQPEAFIIGGGVSLSGEVLFAPLRRHLADRLHPHFFQHVRLLPAELGNDAGMIGCASLVFRYREGGTAAPVRVKRGVK